MEFGSSKNRVRIFLCKYKELAVDLNTFKQAILNEYER